MNAQKNVRTCPLSRALLIQRVFEQGWSVRAASAAVGITDRRGREWLRRAEVGEPRPHCTWSTPAITRKRIISLRRQWLTVRQIAQLVGVSPSTAARVCRAAGLSGFKQLDAPPPPIRYERDRPGELLHIDVKRLGRFDRPGHRVTRRRSYGSRQQGFEFVHVATDDASRLLYAEILVDECASSAMMFLINAVSWFAEHGVTVERIITDNGSAFVSYRYRELCESLHIRHLRIRPHRPQKNGKVERFIQTMLREWAYRFTYRSSDERHRWLAPYLQFSPRPFSACVQSAHQSPG